MTVVIRKDQIREKKGRIGKREYIKMFGVEIIGFTWAMVHTSSLGELLEKDKDPLHMAITSLKSVSQLEPINFIIKKIR